MWIGFVLRACVRLTVILAVSFLVAGVVFKRVVPISSENSVPRVGPFDGVANHRWALLPGKWFAGRHDVTYVLDRRDGRLTRRQEIVESALLFPGTSPQIDRFGHLYSVGVIRSLTPIEGDAHCLLVRYRFIDRQVLNRVSLTNLPNSQLHFAHGSASRVIFTQADGVLYQMTFAEPEPGAPVRPGTEDVTRIHWNGTSPDGGHYYVRDVFWPSHPCFRDHLVASVMEISKTDVPSTASVRGSRLWWLRLSRERDVIEAAGPLLEGDGPNGGPATVAGDELFANVVDVSGRLVCAMLVFDTETSGWLLRVGPLQIEPDTGRPLVPRGQVVTLASQRMPVRPEFSEDRRHVFSARLLADPHQPMDRFAVEPVLPCADSAKNAASK